MTTHLNAEQLDTLRALWHEKIPLTRAMQVKLKVRDGCSVVWAPLVANSNHMNTGFGGSLAALATLAGWAQVWLSLETPEDYHIVIAHTDARFKAPAIDDLEAVAVQPGQETIEKFRRKLKRNSRGALLISVTVFSNQQEVVRFTGKFVATLKRA